MTAFPAPPSLKEEVMSDHDAVERPPHPTGTEPGTDEPEPATAGYSTAELLGNAALAVGALVAIWAGLQGLGESIIDWIGSQLMSG